MSHESWQKAMDMGLATRVEPSPEAVQYDSTPVVQILEPICNVCGAVAKKELTPTFPPRTMYVCQCGNKAFADGDKIGPAPAGRFRMERKRP